MDDLELKQLILDELEFEPSVDPAHIGVAADKGVVTLSGHVKSYAEKLAVQDAVQRIYGVRAIADEIEVRFAASPKMADDEIASRAADILRWHALVPDEKIKITVRHGYVKLTGMVDWQFQKAAAEEAVRKLSHVAGISNYIEIEPRPNVTDIKRMIENALRRSAETEARNIRVSVSEGSVTLEGRVDNWSERNAVISAAWAAPGVNQVDDRLMVM